MSEGASKDSDNAQNDKTKGHGSPASCSTCGNDDRRVRDRLAHIKHKIFVLSGKGGVGKSTVAVNLAWALAEKKNKVGIMDLDIHGPNVPKLLGVSGGVLKADGNGMFPLQVTENLGVISLDFLIKNPDSPVIWRGPMKIKAVTQFIEDVNWGKLDYLIVDLPPGTGDEALTIAQLIPEADGAVIVTTPQDLALMDSRKAVKFTQMLKLPVLGIVENMSRLVCPHCSETIYLFPEGATKRASDELGVPILGSIPFEVDIPIMGDRGVPLVTKKSGSPAAKEFFSIVDAISRSLKAE